MGYGYFGDDVTGGGSAFDPNTINSSSGNAGGGGPVYGTYGTAGGTYGGPDTTPDYGSVPYSGSTAAPSAPASGTTPQAGAAQGGSFGPWGAIIGAAVGSLDSRINSQSAQAAAHAAIPSDAYANFLRGQVQQQAMQGKLLADSKLGPRATAAASTIGARSATARGLQGPLAASVQSNSINQAQGNYDQWRVGMLQNYRQAYFGLVQQYLAALESQRQAKIQAGYADREATYAYLPLDPFVGKPIAQGVNNAVGGPGSNQYINQFGQYNGAVPNF